MKGLTYDMKGKFSNGIYGIDTLTVVILIFAAIFINMRAGYMWLVGVAFLGYAGFRMFSKNKQKRYQELQQFNKLTRKLKHYLAPLGNLIITGFAKLSKWLKTFKTQMQQRKKYVFIRCPQCNNTLRLPRNKGKLSVSCPVCKMGFIKKT